MTHEIRKADLSVPYFESQQWCVDEQLYPESRGHIQRKFDTRAEAEKFIEEAV
jgi:hypothetical protein